MQIGAASSLFLDAYRSPSLSGGRGTAASPKVLSAESNEGRSSASPDELSPEEQKVVAELARTDREVRIHEQMHMSAGGGVVTGGPSFSYTTGPDGKRYAVGGEVSISTSPGRTPEETIAKAQQIQRAALAPAKPSGQDQQVAAAAARMAAEAYRELAAQRTEQATEKTGGDANLNEEAVGRYQQVQASSNTAQSTIDAFA